MTRHAWSCFGAVIGLVGFAGCRKAESPPALLESYRAAVERTASMGIAFERGSEKEKEVLERFEKFYEVYSTESIRTGVRELYAAAAYFGDPFRSVEGIDAIEAYFLEMAKPVKSCIFRIDGVEADGAEYYFRWTMELTIKRAPKNPITALGLSHVRFDAGGQVIFQQDYWDTSVLFERLPVVGGMTRWIKRRL